MFYALILSLASGQLLCKHDRPIFAAGGVSDKSRGDMTTQTGREGYRERVSPLFLLVETGGRLRAPQTSRRTGLRSDCWVNLSRSHYFRRDDPFHTK